MLTAAVLQETLVIDLGPFFIFVGVLVIAGAGNAVNLTDGLEASPSCR